MTTATPTFAHDIAKLLAPSGTFRAAINLGNSILTWKRETGEIGGITVDIARELARRLACHVELIPFDSAGQVTATVAHNIWDVGFLAIDPKRATEIEFTAAYIIIEGTYLVPDASRFQTITDVDSPGVRISAEANSAYDLYLARELKHATRVHLPPMAGTKIEHFATGAIDVAAGIRQPLLAFAKAHPQFRVLPGRFMAINQAMGLPKGHVVAAAFIKSFIEDLKASGFVADAIKRHNQPGASVAPLERFVPLDN